MQFSFGLILVNTLLFACPLLLLCTGGILNTRAGIVNFGFDGTMCVGAAIYCLTVSQLRSELGNSAAVLGFFLTIIAGMILSLMHSLATILLRANQFLISMAINYLGYGLAMVLPLVFTGTINFSLTTIHIELLPTTAILLTFLAVYIFAALLFLTKFGLYLRAIGQNPTAVALNYIHVRRSRILISLFSSSLACFAGGLLVYITPMTFIANNNFSGLGFLVVALWMMARSRFVLTTIICIVFAFFYQFSLSAQAYINVTSKIPSWLWGMLPYLVSLLGLMIFRPNTMLPDAWGVPYVKTGWHK